jgi:hypothetical protein
LRKNEQKCEEEKEKWQNGTQTKHRQEGRDYYMR